MVRAVVFLLLLGAAALACAKSIYAYRDANGIQHFTDQKPAASTEGVRETLVRVEQKLRLHLRRDESQPDRTRWFVRNDYGGPVQLSLRSTQADNVLTEPELPATVTLPERQETLLLIAAAAYPQQAWSLQFGFEVAFGKPGVDPDMSFAYALPFALPGGAEIHQAWGGKFSHTSPENYHAVDFALPIGTPVLAARAGVVFDVMDDYFEAGLDPKLASKANAIWITHDDGTMAMYAHLQLDGAYVSVGDRVRAGQQIARSGNSGFSSGPHLHFVVQRNAGMRIESIPFLLRDGVEVIEPQNFQRLGATPKAD